MDLTDLARSLLGPIPAHRTMRLEVLRAADTVGVVAVQVRPKLTNVIGSLHSSGLITLIDAAGLAAIISAAPSAAAFAGIVPLGGAASLRFRAPARGRLIATCALDDQARQQLAEIFAGATRVRFTTTTTITGENGAVVCEGSFDWSVRCTVPAAKPYRESRFPVADGSGSLAR
jgi:acyl-coenzyme A thioesterase PaaI-like protein